MKHPELVLAILFLMPLSATAHHATATEYDIAKTIVLTGTILQVDWANPHMHVYLEVKSGKGAPQVWDVEFPSPGAATVAGLSRALLAPGTVLHAEAFASKPDFHPPARNKGKAATPPSPEWFACATAVTLPDGSRATFVVGI